MSGRCNDAEDTRTLTLIPSVSTPSHCGDVASLEASFSSGASDRAAPAMAMRAFNLPSLHDGFLSKGLKWMDLSSIKEKPEALSPSRALDRTGSTSPSSSSTHSGSEIIRSLSEKSSLSNSSSPSINSRRSGTSPASSRLHPSPLPQSFLPASRSPSGSPSSRSRTSASDCDTPPAVATCPEKDATSASPLLLEGSQGAASQGTQNVLHTHSSSFLHGTVSAIQIRGSSFFNNTVAVLQTKSSGFSLQGPRLPLETQPPDGDPTMRKLSFAPTLDWLHMPSFPVPSISLLPEGPPGLTSWSGYTMGTPLVDVDSELTHRALGEVGGALGKGCPFLGDGKGSESVELEVGRECASPLLETTYSSTTPVSSATLSKVLEMFAEEDREMFQRFRAVMKSSRASLRGLKEKISELTEARERLEVASEKWRLRCETALDMLNDTEMMSQKMSI